MNVIYVETSALLSWLFGESQGEKVIRRINKADTILTSVVTFIEVERAIIRAERLKILNVAQSQKLRGILAKVQTGFLIMELSEEVRKRAIESFPIEPLRTLDAIHLATAVVFSKAYETLQIVSFDKRIISNAKVMGLTDSNV